ncbi:3'-5' exonuclease [Brachybacterium kimchii]|uniref:Exonuclease domain-containing protein n=1 Tax=Brachybacterium kimchii TaxID=2942909 RepID=A0ABY4NDT0_9MICO|nr:exonuclease domain-containing protein [Brachybacterium kimchii]UQN31804.1 exonuclease domain-containing protein [Brachybacterium kimchii]
MSTHPGHDERIIRTPVTTSLPLVFVDTETTMLEPTPKPWEIALIKQEPGELDQRVHIMIRDVDISDASPDSLELNGFYRRHANWSNTQQPEGASVLTSAETSRIVEEFTAGTQLVGVNPDFDARALEWLLRQHGLRPRWRHQSINLVTWTYPVLAQRGQAVNVPTSSYELAAQAGAEPPSNAEAHTALGDALWAQRWWDALVEEDR